ncbi:hypothetical protein OIU77_010703 [Salix suchowensis]|uniref:Uncharacterized protein n=1 Tax=Salix suchowensis TaxID=1278906 RepID=A0ABQ9A993_9ROSI|nr:hypothetical protein OIU77_010703 [Salix suchowensis]
MILSRLAATATRSYRSLSLAYTLARIRGFATDPTGRPRDPEVCAGREYETQHAVPIGKPEVRFSFSFILFRSHLTG